MGQCFLDYDGLKQFWKVVRDNTVCVYVMNLARNSFNDIDALEMTISNFDGLESILKSGKFPDMIKLRLNTSAHIFTLYDTDFTSYAYYRCDGKNAEIVIDTNVVSFSVN